MVATKPASFASLWLGLEDLVRIIFIVSGISRNSGDISRNVEGILIEDQ